MAAETSRAAKAGSSNLSQEAFEQLQRKLVPMWRDIGRSDPGGPLQEANTIVVLPSLTVDAEIEALEQQAYEERFLFMLFLLRQPNIQLIYLTSQPIHPSVTDYYLDILPGVVSSHARSRLKLVSPMDGSTAPLAQKLLDRPRLLGQIRALIPNLDRAHIVPFTTTDLEREVAVRLGIPMYAADPRFFAFGTKSGGRRIFAEEGVAHPLGIENLASVAAVIEAIAALRDRKPGIRKLILKLNEGVGGMGNAVLDLGGLPDPGSPGENEAIASALPNLQFELEQVAYSWYMDKLGEVGAVIEELITGEAFASPSVQLRVSPLGEVEVLSTHDQLLGGPSGQSYLGARFPAHPAYCGLIVPEAVKIGRRFAQEGVVGRFAVDFVVVKHRQVAWDPYAIEVNLRKGGTTAPYLTLQYLTDGRFDPDTGLFTTRHGREKYYVASDHLEAPHFRSLTPADLFEIVSRHRLHFDHTHQAGVVFHMMSSVGGLGQFGLTAIEDSPEQAEALFQRVQAVIAQEAQALAGT